MKPAPVSRFAMALAVLLLAVPVSGQEFTAGADSAGAASLERITARSPGLVSLSRDSLLRFERHSAADLAVLLPGMRTLGLGSQGQPSYLSFNGATAYQSALVLNGFAIQDPVTGHSDPYLLPVDDAASIMSWPAHQALWIGGPGAVSAVELRVEDLDAPSPVTRLRHTEGPYDYLFTNVDFAIDPMARHNLHATVTRRTVGSSSAGNSARFASTRAESWDLRARYRIDLSETARLTIANHYNDQLIFMNGGVFTGATRTPAFEIFPSESESAYADSAFNPIFAALANTTIRTQAIRNEVSAGVQFRWNGDSTMNSRVEIAHTSFGRDYADWWNLPIARTDSALGLTLPDSVARIRRDERRAWNSTALRIEHQMRLGPATLRLHGSVARYATSGWHLLDEEAGIRAISGAFLGTEFGPVTVSLFGSASHTAGRNAGGAGATLELRGKTLTPWLGASMATRANTLFELYGAHAALSSIRHDAAAGERLLIAEAGLRADFDGLSIDARVYGRSVRSPFGLYQQRFGDALFPVLEGSEARYAVYGASMISLLRIWKLVWENRCAVGSTQRFDGAARDAAAPAMQESAEFYYRGSIIDGTLDVKAGFGLDYTSAFAPSTYDAYSGTFAVPHSTASNSGAASYTDAFTLRAFLFATIKQRATIFVTWHNITDAEYIAVQFHQMPGSEIRFGVDWTLFE